MPPPGTGSPTLIEAAVLGALIEQPSHGFELAKTFEPNGWLGEIFTVRRPVVYRALNTLDDKGLLTGKRVEVSDRGPDRTVVRVNAAGRRTFDEWLTTPVEHMRDVRVELLVKLALHERLGRDAQPFIDAQAEHFSPIYAALQAAPTPSEGIERYVALWRKLSSRSVMLFLDEIAVRRSDQETSQP